MMIDRRMGDTISFPLYQYDMVVILLSSFSEMRCWLTVCLYRENISIDSKLYHPEKSYSLWWCHNLKLQLLYCLSHNLLLLYKTRGMILFIVHNKKLTPKSLFFWNVEQKRSFVMWCDLSSVYSYRCHSFNGSIL